MKAAAKLGWNFIGIGMPLLSYVNTRPRHWINDFTDQQELGRIFDSIGIKSVFPMSLRGGD